MVRFTLNGAAAEAAGGRTLLDFLRGEAGLTGAKRACGEGACGACSVIVDGALIASCVLPIERVEGKSVLTIEGLGAEEAEDYSAAFASAGAVQCGYCTPGMVLAAKVLIDRDPDPSEREVRAALRRNLCRCTGYAKIVAGVLAAAARRRARSESGSRPLGGAHPSPDARSAADARPSADGARAGASHLEPGYAAIGSRLTRVDAIRKALGKAEYVDDLDPPPGMLYGAALRTPHPRARLVALDVSAARALPGVRAVATWEDVPGRRFTGHVVPDWPALIAVGEETRYVGDAVALVAAESPAIAREALGLVRAEYEVLPPLRDPDEALAPGAPALHPGGNVLSRIELRRGNADAALAGAAHVVAESFSTPSTDHAFLEPESALAFPPDAEGLVRAWTGEQNVYDGRRYIADTLGLPEERVRVSSAYVGGGFGGKEDQTVQHHAALLALLAGRPVRCTLDRAESQRVHVKRHAMRIELSVGCDARGALVGLKGRIVADTGAYASLGGPVLHRAVTHLGGPYKYGNIDVEGLAVFTNNPPAGAFRGFGVPQVAFALETALDRLARLAGLSPWELRFRNAVRPGDVLPNGQAAGADTALAECLLAVKPAMDAARGPVGIACAFKNTGIGVGHADVGRVRLAFGDGRLVVYTGAACVGQGLATILTQIACGTLGLPAELVEIALPDTALAPDSGTTTASRQTLITGEACRRACAAALEAARRPGAGSGPAPAGSALLGRLSGREFRAEYVAETDPFDTDKTNPVRHVAYSYACQAVFLGEDGRLARVVAAHDSGLVVNPLAFEGQVEGGVAMGLGFALTESFPLADCVPVARFGQLGLLRAAEVPPIETIIVRAPGRGGAADGGVADAGYGAKGIGEISSIPTAAATANAYYARDGEFRASLPLARTPYARK